MVRRSGNTFVLERFACRRKQPKATVSKLRCCHEIKQASLRYADMLPMHKIWQGYMRSLRRATTVCYLKTDYHGCLMRVSHALNVSQIGIAGMMIMETRLTFMFLTKQDRVLTVPKAGSVFQFLLDDQVFTLIGEDFLGTVAGRVQKKLKKRAICPVFLDQLGLCK